MSINRLQITSTDNNSSQQVAKINRGTRRQEIQATMERLWLIDPEQFNPDRDAVQKRRIANTIAMIKEFPLESKRCADLGCGSGVISTALSNAGAIVDAVDVASQALDGLKAKNIKNIRTIQDCLPSTCLEDNAYDLVICTETIGYLQPKEYRMLFAELSRLIRKEGSVVCSTSLDIDTENALERFAALAETEFEIDCWILRYDLLWIKCCRFFETPAFFIKATQNNFERNKEIRKRKSFSRNWFKMNTANPGILFWKGINFVFRPIASWIRQSDRLVGFLEKTTKLLWDEAGISHALFLGKRRPMTFPLAANEIPLEMKHKRQVWE